MPAQLIFLHIVLSKYLRWKEIDKKQGFIYPPGCTQTVWSYAQMGLVAVAPLFSLLSPISDSINTLLPWQPSSLWPWWVPSLTTVINSTTQNASTITVSPNKHVCMHISSLFFHFITFYYYRYYNVTMMTTNNCYLAYECILMNAYHYLHPYNGQWLPHHQKKG